ncbi:hypothetical protein [Bifidobacterium sp. ESL0704]|uniref:hypothetical protein n=1 Tax=Bifidobacterium sp. ESL0704 TaxID=2983219 RepID=UPI0023F99700|nr:hypothetical protein [Bifidobacterium sp. ESL0704]WEV53265.1 hypothetical protein OZX64_01870 [Bifidobacterium sp. ESL0704]
MMIPHERRIVASKQHGTYGWRCLATPTNQASGIYDSCNAGLQSWRRQVQATGCES